ncbi:hypothetical protein GCM10011608_29360 [Micromonospora sonchi]|uniref:PKD domain-containing protein n=1 Tax=Micromonospora sonchi TaxID=1763543 RepID=A0A917WZF2_9ACTN|nr:hypothetical protein GCM10011608_29360 [Micromonospora sonchi]
MLTPATTRVGRTAGQIDTRDTADRPRGAGRRWLIGGRQALLAAGLALLLATGPAVPATAAGPGAGCPPAQPNCDVWDDDPGTPGGGNNGGGGNGGGGNGGGGGGVCQWEGRTIPCYDEALGWFNSGEGCYYKIAESPPEEPPPGYQYYTRSCYGGAISDVSLRLLAEPPPGFGAPPDPEELARRAFASITLLAPRASVAPRKRIGPGLVGLPVWMWAERGRNQFGPLEASATDRGLTVTIEAKVEKVVWDMGNGIEVTCTGPGTAYDTKGPRAGRRSPDCGYHSGYPKAGAYQVRATAYWTVEWRSSSGQAGNIPGVTRITNPVDIQINELQVVTR